MAESTSKLAVILTADISNLRSNLGAGLASIQQFANRVPFVGSAFSAATTVGSGAVAGLTTAIAGTGVALGAATAAGLGWGATLAANAEDAEIRFNTFLKSGEAAKGMINELSQFAAATPFELGDLTSAATGLASAGIAADDIMPRLKVLGDVASGSGARLEELVNVFAKFKSKGTLNSEILDMFQERKVNLIPELAKQFGVAESEVGKLVSTGKIGLPEVEKALVSMTSGTGIFANAMENLSKGTTGRMSTLKDAVGGLFRDINKAFGQALGLPDQLAGMSTAIEQFSTKFAKPIGEGLAWIATKGVSTFQEILAYLKPWGASAADVVIGVATAAEFGWNNAGRIVDLAMMQAELAIVRTGGIITHFFTVQIPTVASWFGQNWRDVMTDVFNFSATVFSNLAKNIGSTMQSVWAYIASGGTQSLSVAWTPLAEGFESTIKNLPEIPDRILSDHERTLTAQVDGLKTSLAGGVTKMLTDRFQFMDSLLAPGPTTASTAYSPGEFKYSDPTAKGKDDKKEKAQKTPEFGAYERGSKEAYQAIVKARDSQARKAEKAALDTAKNTRDAAESLKKLVTDTVTKVVEVIF